MDCLANTRVTGQFPGLDELANSGSHPSIWSLIKELEERRDQTELIPSEAIPIDR